MSRKSIMGFFSKLRKEFGLMCRWDDYLNFRWIIICETGTHFDGQLTSQTKLNFQNMNSKFTKRNTDLPNFCIFCFVTTIYPVLSFFHLSAFCYWWQRSSIRQIATGFIKQKAKKILSQRIFMYNDIEWILDYA